MNKTNGTEETNKIPQYRPTDFAWPTFLPGMCHIGKKTEYGFDIYLPGYSKPKEVREGSLEKQNVEKQPTKIAGEDETKDDEREKGTVIDYDELDRLFSKMNSFNGKLTTKYSTYGVIDHSPNLSKRPPRAKDLARRGRDQPGADKSTPTRSSYSKMHDDVSDSFENVETRTKNVAKGQVGARNGQRVRAVLGTTRHSQPASSANHLRQRGLRSAARRSPVRIPFRQDQNENVNSRGEWILIDFIRELVLKDNFKPDLMKMFNEVELEIAYRILRMRYKGAEFFRFPSRIKNINPENNKCNIKFMNEKKLLGEVWPWIIDELKNFKQLWQVDKDEAIVEVFKVYHKPIYMDDILREVNDNTIRSLVKEGNDTLLVNLFAELYLGFPQ